MTPTWTHLLLFYGLCFGFQNKVPFLYKLPIFKSMLPCTYCTGFHMGWIAWLFQWGLSGETPAVGGAIIPSIITWGRIASAWCYAIDAGVKWFEVNSVLEDVEEAE